METKKPSLLDVVKIDGRFAQVCPGENSFVFLSEKARKESVTIHDVDWNDYNYTPPKSPSLSFVGALRERGKISDREYMTIHWGSEQEKNPHLKNCVTYFGDYELKKFAGKIKNG